jgi:hypothetical protein
MHTHNHLFNNCTITAIAIAAMLVPVQRASAQVGLGLNPMRVELAAVAGRPYSGTLMLSNSTSAKVRVKVELLDFYVDSTMTPQFVPGAPSESAYTCRDWLTVNPMEVELGPESQVPARYTVRVPADAAERSFHCAIGFLTVPVVTEEENNTGMVTAVRMVATLYPIVGKPEIKGEIKDIKLEQLPAGAETAWRAVVVMENTGQVLFRPTGAVDVLDSDGKVIESTNLTSFPALPMRQQRYLVPIKTSLSPGQYKLRARVEVGAEVQEASAAVTAEAPQPAVPAEVRLK